MGQKPPLAAWGLEETALGTSYFRVAPRRLLVPPSEKPRGWPPGTGLDGAWPVPVDGSRPWLSGPRAPCACLRGPRPPAGSGNPRSSWSAGQVPPLVWGTEPVALRGGGRGHGSPLSSLSPLQPGAGPLNLVQHLCPRPREETPLPQHGAHGAASRELASVGC